MVDKAQEAAQDSQQHADADSMDAAPIPHERQPLLSHQLYTSEPGPSTPGPASGAVTPAADRPRTVRHHRRTLSGRSIRSGHFQFGPSFQSQVYPAASDSISRQARRAADARARSRFIKALALSIGLWLFIGLLLGWSGFRDLSGRSRLDYGSKPAVPPSEGSPVDCASFTETANPSSRVPKGYQASTASFDIPLTMHDLFFIHGLGSFAKGKIHFRVTGEEIASAKVVVEARYNDARLVDLMQVCQVRKLASDKDNSKRNIGLGIYTPTPEVGPYPESDLDFDVNVHLPSTLERLHAMQVRGESFAIDAGDLTSLSIDLIDFESKNSRISFKSIKAHAIRAKTSNGALSGHFNISRSLTLASTNGAIMAQIALFPRSPADDHLPRLPRNHLHSEQEIFANIASQHGDGDGTCVHATTTNGAVEVKYIQHPSGQKLYSYAASTNGRVQVDHTPEYQGTFHAETIWGSASVNGPDSTDDPAGRGRERVKNVTDDQHELGHRLVEGRIWWQEKYKDVNQTAWGDTTVKTTLGSARIDFT